MLTSPQVSWSGSRCIATLGDQSVTLEFPPGEEFVGQGILSGAEYPLPDEFLMALRGLTVVDIGAHCGSATAYFWLMLRPRALYAFEPDERARKFFKESFAAHDAIRLSHGAVAGESGTRDLYTLDPLCLSSIVDCAWKDEGRAVRVECVSGEKVLDLIDGPIGVLKIDAEGAEAEILRSMGQGLSRVGVIFLEYHSEELRREVDELACGLGFTQFYAHGRWKQGVAGYVNAEYVHLLRDAWGRHAAPRQAAATPVAPRRVKLMFGRFPGGNHDRDDVTDWLVRSVVAAKNDPRIHPQLINWRKNDTPITMTRNECVAKAIESGADFLCIVDNDMHPDFYLPDNPRAAVADPEAKPFFESSFDFLYNRMLAGEPPAIVAAPYCGPPPCENVYVFQWGNQESGIPEDAAYFSLDSYSREQAAIMRGIQEAAALPTGLMLIDMRAIWSTDPPYFYYEWTDITESKKASTEDVTFTRDLSLNGVPQFCNWDAWAGHWKQKCVGRPILITPKQVNRRFKKRVHAELGIHSPAERLVFVGKRGMRNGEAVNKVQERNGRAGKTAEPAAVAE